VTAAVDVAAALRDLYRPAASVRVGILVLGDAFPDRKVDVDAALVAAGHAPLRRKCALLPRVGEERVRADDAIEFVTLYGHEYATALVRPWPEIAGREDELERALTDAGCEVLWDRPA